MQNDLISRSALIEALEKHYNGLTYENVPTSIADFYCEMEKLIKNQPTAYSVEDVVAELKDKAEEHRNIAFDMEAKGFSGIADKQYAKQLACINAIEIIRNGGKE